MTEQEARVLAAVKQSPLATQHTLAAQLGMSRESVAGHIMRLTRSGHILGKGYLVAQDKAMLIIGASNVDIQGHPSDQFYAGDSSQGHIRQSAGGVARNIAENLQRLGVSCRLLTVVGQDQAGDWMLETLSHCGIETRDIWRLAEWPTSRYLSIQNDQGELVAAIADMRILDTLTPHLLQQKHKLLQAAPTILLDANLPEATLEWLAQQPLTATLYADAVSATKAPRLRAILPKLQLLKVNVAEAKALLSTHITDPNTLAQQLLASGVQQILLSLGEQGALLATPQGILRAPAFAVEPISDTGAGDALFAGCIYALSQAWPQQQSLTFALACAGLTLENPHANHPNLCEATVLDWLSTHPYLDTHHA